MHPFLLLVQHIKWRLLQDMCFIAVHVLIQAFGLWIDFNQYKPSYVNGYSFTKHWWYAKHICVILSIDRWITDYKSVSKRSANVVLASHLRHSATYTYIRRATLPHSICLINQSGCGECFFNNETVDCCQTCQVLHQEYEYMRSTNAMEHLLKSL